MTRVLQTVLVLLSCTAAAMAGTPAVPSELTPPAGAKLVLKTHATGAQIYSCKAADDGKFQWVLKAPDAQLHDRNGAVIGQHFAGLIDVLNDHDYRGWLVVEAEQDPAVAPSYDYADRGFRHLRALVDRAPAHARSSA